MTREQMSRIGWTHVDQSLPPQGATVQGFHARSVTHRVDLGLVKLVGETWHDVLTGEPCKEQPNYWRPDVQAKQSNVPSWVKIGVSCE